MTDADSRWSHDVVILDRHLIDEKGHHFPYLESIIQEFRRVGVHASLYANLRVTRDVAAAIGAIPYFATVRLEPGPGKEPWSRLRNSVLAGWHLIRSNLKAYRELVALDPVLKRKGTVIFDPNCDSATLLGHLLWWWLRARSAEMGYVLLIRRPLRLLKPVSFAWSVRRALGRVHKLSRFQAPDGLRFATDSARIREAYPTLDMIVLPIPHTRRESNESACRELETSLQRLRGCRFVYLGRCRSEQGIATLVSALARLREEFRSERICAVIQAAAYADDPEAVAACTRLLELKLPNVLLLTRMVSDAEYDRLLRWTDNVLVPYAAEAYRFRTSGILAEALAGGRAVITTAGTWMSDQVEERSGILFESGDPGSLASAILRAVERSAELLRCAERYAQGFAVFHNPAHFVETLMPASRASEGKE
jgi:glycosyltransferase involved in cell wall biosynthesis